MDIHELKESANIIQEGNLLKTQKGEPLATIENGRISGEYDEELDVNSISGAYVSMVMNKPLLIVKTEIGEQALKYVQPCYRYLNDLMKVDHLSLSYLEMQQLFPALYPEGAGYWNELTERPYLYRNKEEMPLADELKASIFADCESRLNRLFNGRKVKCLKTVIFDTVIENIYLNKRSPVRDWLSELPEWDGVSRICTMFRDMLGTDSRLDPDLDYNYQKEVAECWMVGAIAKQYQEAKHEVIPCLIGPQGIGKSTFIELLSPKQDWYMSTKSDIDKEKDFLDSVRGHVIVEFGEGRTLKSDPDSLKEFLSRSSDSYRQSYARYSQSYPRRWTAIITTNDPVPLVDGSGGRRFYPLYCGENMELRILDPLKDREEIRQHVIQLWAEALYLYQSGRRWWIIDEMGQTIVQDSASRMNIEADYINSRLNEHSDLWPKGAKIAQADIFEVVWPNYVGIPNKDMKSAIHTWQADKNCPWSSRVIKVDNMSKRGFYRIKEYEGLK